MKKAGKTKQKLRKLTRQATLRGPHQRSSGDARGNLSAPRQPALSPWLGQPAAEGVELLESFDKFADHRNEIRALAAASKDKLWAGIPMPLEGHDLVLEPNFPGAANFPKIPSPEEDRRKYLKDIKVRNHFWSTRYRAHIFIYEDKSGRVKFTWEPAYHGLNIALLTLGASVAWGIEQEHNALQLLGTLISHHAFKKYLLTGMFLETSKRSGLTYLFRKLKPTVVLDIRDRKGTGETRILTVLCLHPIGYYKDSNAGAMCPTDDVVAHLSMMRGDEPFFWKRANQIAPHYPEAGL